MQPLSPRNLDVDNLSANATLPRQPGADTTRKNRDGSSSASGLPVASADRSPAVFDRFDGAPERGNQEAPAKTKVCSRSAAPCLLKGKLSPGIVETNASTTVCQGEFEYWVDEFLSIPINEYLKIDERVLDKIDRSYHGCVKKPDVDDNTRAFIKVKHLLNRLLCDWQLKQNREQTRKQLMSLYAYAQDKNGMVHYVQNWVFMKCYKDILFGREVDENKKQAFVTIMNEVVHLGPTVRATSLQFMDVISLAVLYYVGGLPGFEDDANYERCFNMIFLHRTVTLDNYVLFSPISFTAHDYMRFSPEDLTKKLDDQNKVLPGGPCTNIMHMIIAFNMSSRDKNFPLWLSKEDFNFDVYEFVREILVDFYEVLGVIKRGGKALKELPPLKEKMFSMMQYCEKLTSGTKDDCFGLFNYLRAELILSEKELPKRRRYAKVASLYSKTAQRCPNHWSSAYIFYYRAGIWDAAKNAAEHYVRYWQGKDGAMAEYWSDKFGRELQVANSGHHNRPSGEAKQQYDIDTILREFAAEQSFPGPGKKKKKHKQKKTSTDSDSDESQKRTTGQTIPEQPEPVTRPDDSRPCRPMIKALPHGTNQQDGLSGEYQIKGPQGAIRPFEKLLSRHWNPLVKKTLDLIRVARRDGDLVRERRIYQKLLNNPKLKTCIGIERIWEEYAWTELHQFDDCFQTRVMPASIRPQAQKWINMARDSYIMPCLAYCLGLDQICSLIEPEGVWEAVLQLVERPELAKPSVNQEIRFRLRCLFSSMGHTYSLCAMANLRQSQQLMEVARKWYGFKTIDPQFERKGLTVGWQT